MGMRVTVKGDIRKALAGKAQAARRGAARAVTDEADAVADDMRRRAPVGDGKRGRRGKPPLKDSIEASSNALHGEARAKARHANIVEQGTKSHPAQPFGRPAAETSRRRFPKRVAGEVRKEIGS